MQEAEHRLWPMDSKRLLVNPVVLIGLEPWNCQLALGLFGCPGSSLSKPWMHFERSLESSFDSLLLGPLHRVFCDIVVTGAGSGYCVQASRPPTCACRPASFSCREQIAILVLSAILLGRQQAQSECMY